MADRMKVALVGIGKIAVDQHVPAIAASPDWELAATVSRKGHVDGVEAFTTIEAMLEARPDIGVVSLALPPVPRFAYAEAALKAGRHVMLEKPPGATLAEVHALQALAGKWGLTLYATWHSRMAHAVAPAKAWLEGKTVTRAHITWREDVRKWHPGQDWVFEPGGFGVFDPGINALSIFVHILPGTAFVRSAELTYPANRQTPIAARLVFSSDVAGQPELTADFDWREQGDEKWHMMIETADGRSARLFEGGASLSIDGKTVVAAPREEYERIYERFTALLDERRSDVDGAPLRLVADAMLVGTRLATAPFEW